jgi:hypothetical protein
MMSATYGPTFAKPLAHYDQNLQCWKTSGDTSAWDSQTLLPTLPQWGTTQNGALYALAMPERHTSEQGCSLLPTPTVVDMGNNKTPAEWEEWKQVQRLKHRNGNGHGASLTQEAIQIGLNTLMP